jgi:hypothetical protein
MRLSPSATATTSATLPGLMPVLGPIAAGASAATAGLKPYLAGSASSVTTALVTIFAPVIHLPDIVFCTEAFVIRPELFSPLAATPTTRSPLGSPHVPAVPASPRQAAPVGQSTNTALLAPTVC